MAYGGRCFGRLGRMSCELAHPEEVDSSRLRKRRYYPEQRPARARRWMHVRSNAENFQGSSNVQTSFGSRSLRLYNKTWTPTFWRPRPELAVGSIGAIPVKSRSASSSGPSTSLEAHTRRKHRSRFGGVCRGGRVPPPAPSAAGGLRWSTPATAASPRRRECHTSSGERGLSDRRSEAAPAAMRSGRRRRQKNRTRAVDRLYGSNPMRLCRHIGVKGRAPQFVPCRIPFDNSTRMGPPSLPSTTPLKP